jgi:hypothetical protein
MYSTLCPVRTSISFGNSTSRCSLTLSGDAKASSPVEMRCTTQQKRSEDTSEERRGERVWRRGKTGNVRLKGVKGTRD